MRGFDSVAPLFRAATCLLPGYFLLSEQHKKKNAGLKPSAAKTKTMAGCHREGRPAYVPADAPKSCERANLLMSTSC
jgi:hypothetical protein